MLLRLTPLKIFPNTCTRSLNFPGLSIWGGGIELDALAVGAADDPDEDPRTKDGTVLDADLVSVAVAGDLRVEAVEGVSRFGV